MKAENIYNALLAIRNDGIDDKSSAVFLEKINALLEWCAATTAETVELTETEIAIAAIDADAAALVVAERLGCTTTDAADAVTAATVEVDTEIATEVSESAITP